MAVGTPEPGNERPLPRWTIAKDWVLRGEAVSACRCAVTRSPAEEPLPEGHRFGPPTAAPPNDQAHQPAGRGELWTPESRHARSAWFGVTWRRTPSARTTPGI